MTDGESALSIAGALSFISPISILNPGIPVAMLRAISAVHKITASARKYFLTNAITEIIINVNTSGIKS